ncbi:hypothetical protein [Aestuariimicrobium sp. Y1814]|uniref:hypothetical protein n=1 Tax=Aestuariimicrobium sp. Y1814 TaxID=3418742 RepID=UPI003DA74FAE
MPPQSTGRAAAAADPSRRPVANPPNPATTPAAASNATAATAPDAPPRGPFVRPATGRSARLVPPGSRLHPVTEAAGHRGTETGAPLEVPMSRLASGGHPLVPPALIAGRHLPDPRLPDPRRAGEGPAAGHPAPVAQTPTAPAALTGWWPELPATPVPTIAAGPPLEPSLRRLERLNSEQAAT